MFFAKRMHAYPEELEMFVRSNWTEKAMAGSRFGLELTESSPPDPLPVQSVLRLLLSNCYQASLMREEGRPTKFRMILCEPDLIARSSDETDGLQRLAFTSPLPFTATELRRLSPAVSFERALVGVRVGPQGVPEIWGIIQSDANWIRAQEGSRAKFALLPASLVIAVRGPGRLTVARGSFTIVRLQGGRMVPPSTNLLETAYQLPDGLAASEELLEAHRRDRQSASRPWADLDPHFARQLRLQLALRIVSAVRNSKHGGTLLFIGRDLARNPEVLNRRLRLKYPFQSDGSRFCARAAVINAMNALAEVCGESHPPPALVGLTEYVGSNHPRVVAADEAISELARFLASLTAVDGVLVMSHSLELLGFGGEIAGDLPEVDFVARVVDPESQEIEMEAATAFGTRHRSAYRFCRAQPGCAALVISHDSGMRVVTCVEDQVQCWEQLTAGVLDI